MSSSAVYKRGTNERAAAAYMPARIDARILHKDLLVTARQSPLIWQERKKGIDIDSAAAVLYIRVNEYKEHTHTRTVQNCCSRRGS